jgi:hypothetical protein
MSLLIKEKKDSKIKRSIELGYNFLNPSIIK